MRWNMVALSLSLGLCMAGLPIRGADAARSDARNSQSTSRQHMSVRSGFSALPSSQRATPARMSRAQAARRGTTSYSFGGGISCVPYARSVTGMNISGNGRDWWHNAAGRYARSSRPEVGAILSFPSSGGMRSGHVAVVSRVVHSRLIEIDHANWGGPGIRRGSVMQGVDVIDVSPSNDWTQVRVQVGHSNANFGREYPTHGFILNRPDDGGSNFAYASYRSGGYSRAVEGRATRATSRQPQLTRVVHQPARPARR